MTHPNKKAEILIAMGQLLLCHIAFIAFVTLIFWLRLPFPFLSFALAGIGVTQLFYAIPLYLRFKRQRRFSAMKGVVIGVVLTILLNGGCFGFVLWALSGMHG